MQKGESKKKIIFIRYYWEKVLNVDIYTYEKFKLSNLNTYLDELINIITLLEHEREVSKRKNGLNFFLEEISSYIRSNYFFKKEYSEDVAEIWGIIKKILRSKHSDNIKNDLAILRRKIKEFRKRQNEIVCRLLRNLTLLIYSNDTLETVYIKLKSVVNDLITELLNSRYSRKFLSKDLFSNTTYDPIKQEVVKIPLKEHFQTMVESLSEKTRIKDVEVIFRINNLKLMMPYKLNELYFYNPSRYELLEWKFKKKVTYFEEGLLYRKEKELLKKSRQSNQNNLTDEEWNEIQYTDAHCRIYLKRVNVNFAADIARKKAEETVNTLRYIYHLDHISVSSQYALKYGDKGKFPLFREKDKDKYIRGSYRGFELDKDLQKDKQDKESRLNTVLSIRGQQKEWLLKGLRSLYIGEDQDLPLNKFIHYWISLEYLVGVRGGKNIKSSLLNNCSEILTRNYFRIELIQLYQEIKNVFYKSQNSTTLSGTKVPIEITELPGLNDFMFKANLYTIADNLELFEKYCNNEYLVFRIREFSDIYNNLEKRRIFISTLETNYKNLLASLYRIRNKIFHSALVDEIELELYCDWLHSIVIALCNDLTYRSKVNANIEEYRVWKKTASENKYCIMGYN